MDPNDKKTALRMIPYGLYVLTGESEDGKIGAEVVDAGVRQAVEGRPDEMTLTLKDLGEKVFYGG